MGGDVFVPSALIASAGNNANEYLAKHVAELGYLRPTIVASGGEARRRMGDIDFEVVIINTPLPDEFGHELSTYAVEKSNAGVILLAKAGTADQISDKLQQHGVLVLAKPFTGDDPFVVIYGDDVIWGEDPVCAQLIRAYEEFGRPVAGVSAVPWEDVSRYCSLKTTPIHDNYFFVDDMIEKPKKGQEFSNYSILGRVLLTPEIYEILAHTKPGAGGEIQLTDAMAEYARTRGGMTAVEFTGKHYDMGNKLKVVEAQVELALQHPEIGEEFRAYLKEFCKTL
jgi:NDP-sugar pyrophosphorylase family protein